jgi:hypothetical protein
MRFSAALPATGISRLTRRSPSGLLQRFSKVDRLDMFIIRKIALKELRKAAPARSCGRAEEALTWRVSQSGASSRSRTLAASSSNENDLLIILIPASRRPDGRSRCGYIRSCRETRRAGFWPTALSASWRPLSPPGITTSVSRRSTCAPPPTTLVRSFMTRR